jgi:hypothetical protein
MLVPLGHTGVQTLGQVIQVGRISDAQALYTATSPALPHRSRPSIGMDVHASRAPFTLPWSEYSKQALISSIPYPTSVELYLGYPCDEYYLLSHGYPK